MSNPNVVYAHQKSAPKKSKGSFKAKAKKFSGFDARPWQIACAKKLRGKRLVNVSAPCGSGKTVALIMLAAQELYDSGLKQKQLIVAPQRVIGDAFTETRTVAVDGEKFTWQPELNDFLNYKQASVIRGLRRWLLDSPATLLKNVTDNMKLDEMVAITSHQALSIVWRKMTKAQRKQALKNLTITVDEAHHISGVFDENGTVPLTPEEKAEANHLGMVIREAVHAGSTHVRLATATFYRGDSQPILDASIAKDFQDGTYILSWQTHWDENLKELERFRIDYRFYKGEPVTQTLKQIVADSDHYYMIFVPPSNLSWRKNHPKRLKALFAGLRKQYGDDAVLDLVTQGGTQDANVRRLRADVARIKAGGKPTFRVIVSCSIGLEGMDYVPVDRLINLGVQNSIVRAIQVMGRPMRDFAGKKVVEIVNYIPKCVRLGKGITLADALADRTNAMLTCLAWDDITSPIIIKLLTLTSKGEGGKKTSTLAEALGSQYAKVIEAALTAVEHLDDKSPDAVREAVEAVLYAAHIPASAELIEGLIVAVRRAQLKAHNSPKAQKLSNLFDVTMLRKSGFNILKKYKLDSQTIFFGDCTKTELKTVRKAIQDLTGLDDLKVLKAHWVEYHGGA